MPIRFPLLLLAASVSLPVLGDTVWLKNGDRLTGKVSVLDGGKLLVVTDYAGSIPLDWKQVATLATDRALLVKQDAFDNGDLYSIHAAEEGQVTLVSGERTETVALSAISQIVQPKPVVRDLTWKGNIYAALDYKRAESDTDDYNIALDTQARHGLWRHKGLADYNREYADGVTVTHNWDVEYALDRFFDERRFWQGRLSYSRDQIEEVRRQRTIGTGPGFQFWDNELGAFSLAALLNYSDLQYDTGEEDSFSLLAAKWDYNRYLKGKTFELFSQGELGKPLASVADYTLDATVGLRYKVTDWASLSMRAEKDLINGAEGDLDETRYSIGFGIGW